MKPLASPSNNYHYNKKLKVFANKLRKRMTKSEACVWKYLLRAQTFYGFSFRRQRPILNYIADFCCFELMLIIEIDGITHLTFDAKIKDQKRDEELLAVGFTTLRFSAIDVLNNMIGVSEMIAAWVEKKTGIKLNCFEDLSL